MGQALVTLLLQRLFFLLTGADKRKELEHIKRISSNQKMRNSPGPELAIEVNI